MGSYSKAITQDLRTVVEGATKVSAPESVFAEPLGVGVKAGEWVSGVTTVMPGGIHAGGAVTVQGVTPEALNTVVSSVLSSSEKQLAEQEEKQSEQLFGLTEKFAGSIQDIIQAGDLYTNSLISQILQSSEKQTEQAIGQAKTAITELGETTKQIAEEKTAEEQAGIYAVPKNVVLLIVGFLVLLLFLKGK